MCSAIKSGDFYCYVQLSYRHRRPQSFSSPRTYVPWYMYIYIFIYIYIVRYNAGSLKNRITDVKKLKFNCPEIGVRGGWGVRGEHPKTSAADGKRL